MGNTLSFWPEWTVEAKIGQGSYGSVYRIRKHGEQNGSADIYSAMKVLRIPMDDSEIRYLRNQGMDAADLAVIDPKSLKQFTGLLRLGNLHI